MDFNNKRVLDIGCRDGLFSFFAESRGAAEVIGIDNDLSKPAVEFLIPFFNSKIKMYEMNLYDLKPDTFGLFDLVIFPGVLYHLRYPFWGLKVIRDLIKVGGQLLLETAIWEGDPNNAMLFCPIDKDSPFEGTSCTFFNHKGITDTLRSMGMKVSSAECLTKDYQRKVKDLIRQSLRNLKSLMGAPPPIKSITRCVFKSSFLGIDKESVLMKYWESCHDIHDLGLGKDSVLMK
jgi:2-polyprenyl-3-methyl-5-hydroxy-6-metoxy-1,4-benzoquinol methylase